MKSEDTLLDEINSKYKELILNVKILEAQFDTLKERQSSFSHQLETHMSSKEEEFKELHSTLHSHMLAVEAKALSGFPDNDPASHREYHIELISNNKVRKARINEIITSSLKNAVWAAITIVAAALWFYFKKEVKS